MALFDNITGFFSGATAGDAANKQVAGLQAGYGQASDLLGKGRDALTTNYTAGLQPFMQNFATGTAGTKSLTDALGITGDPSQVQARFAQTPGYKFALDQGNENVLRNASRTGAGNSGQVNLDLQKQGQGLADQTYQSYVQNLMPFLNQTNTSASGIGNMYAGLGQGINTSFGQQAGAAYGTQADIGKAQADAELAKNSGVQNMFGLGLNALKLGAGAAGGGAFGGGPGGGATFSDIRLKEDIEPVGELYDGTGVYRYRYIGDNRPHIGLLAQEVEERNPDAVREFAGFKAVDYDRATQFAARLAEFI